MLGTGTKNDPFLIGNITDNGGNRSRRSVLKIKE